MQRLFLSRATQLPNAQAGGDAYAHGSSKADQPKPAIQTHAIILGMTYIVIIGFIAILASLVAAMLFMLKGGEKDKQDAAAPSKAKANAMAKALAFRVGFSILLFICILLAWKFGYIQPTGIAAGK
jgi:cytochrome c biogenesis protein CcdA